MGLDATPIRATMAWLFGPIVWAAHFFLVYGVVGFLCVESDAARQTRIQLFVGVVTAVALAVLAGFLTRHIFVDRQHREDGGVTDVSSFLRTTAMALAGLAIIGVMWVAAGATLIPACAHLAE